MQRYIIQDTKGKWKDLQDTQGRTVLMYAIQKNRTAIAQIIIINQDDSDYINRINTHEKSERFPKGKTALDYAIEKGDGHIKDMLIRYHAAQRAEEIKRPRRSTKKQPTRVPLKSGD